MNELGKNTKVSAMSKLEFDTKTTNITALTDCPIRCRAFSPRSLELFAKLTKLKQVVELTLKQKTSS